MRTLTLVVLAASLSASADAKERGECAIEITSAEARHVDDRAPTFRATQILDVRFDVLLPRRLAGDHQVDIDVQTPNGHLYQRLTVPFVGARHRKLRTRRLRGYPFAVREQEHKEHLQRGRASYAVSATLPVAGTSIVTSSLYGGWSAQAFLDGADEPCGKRAVFRIEE